MIRKRALSSQAWKRRVVYRLGLGLGLSTWAVGYQGIQCATSSFFFLHITPRFASDATDDLKGFLALDLSKT